MSYLIADQASYPDGRKSLYVRHADWTIGKLRAEKERDFLLITRLPGLIKRVWTVKSTWCNFVVLELDNGFVEIAMRTNHHSKAVNKHYRIFSLGENPSLRDIIKDWVILLLTDKVHFRTGGECNAILDLISSLLEIIAWDFSFTVQTMHRAVVSHYRVELAAVTGDFTVFTDWAKESGNIKDHTYFQTLVSVLDQTLIKLREGANER